LDEPTAALNVSVKAVVLNLLVDLKALHELLFVSHGVNAVRLPCACVIVMRAAEIAEEGLSDEPLVATKTNTRATACRHPPPSDVTARDLCPPPDLDEFIAPSARALALPVDPA